MFFRVFLEYERRKERKKWMKKEQRTCRRFVRLFQSTGRLAVPRTGWPSAGGRCVLSSFRCLLSSSPSCPLLLPLSSRIFYVSSLPFRISKDLPIDQQKDLWSFSHKISAARALPVHAQFATRWWGGSEAASLIIVIFVRSGVSLLDVEGKWLEVLKKWSEVTIKDYT